MESCKRPHSFQELRPILKKSREWFNDTWSTPVKDERPTPSSGPAQQLLRETTANPNDEASIFIKEEKFATAGTTEHFANLRTASVNYVDTADHQFPRKDCSRDQLLITNTMDGNVNEMIDYENHNIAKSNKGKGVIGYCISKPNMSQTHQREINNRNEKQKQALKKKLGCKNAGLRLTDDEKLLLNYMSFIQTEFHLC